MLETEEVDEDYFTPTPNTSLANIFGKSRKEEKVENESLKYIPPKPQNLTIKPEETKATECIFACTLFGYEWFNNIYTAKGKLGLAILKVIKTGYHNIILYDSNISTMSYVTILPTLVVTVKDSLYISYYDNQQKYWSLYGKEDEIKKIVDTLKNLNTIIKYTSDIEKGPPAPDKAAPDRNVNVPPSDLSNQVEKESDTDSSVNRKTKLSILNRISNMGQSILPPSTLSVLKTSDSSDTNEHDDHPKTLRHKMSKSIIKRNTSEKHVTENQSLLEANRIPLTKTDHSIENKPLYTYICGQLVPVTNSSIITSPTNNTSDMNLFMSEQRISNSELRINMNRMTDKVDLILGKITDLDKNKASSAPTNFQNEILQKLLTEYENKIKAYEELIKSKGIDTLPNTSVKHENNMADNLNQQYVDEIMLLKVKLSKFEETNLMKDNEIARLQADIKQLQEKCNEIITEEETSKKDIFKEMEKLKQELLCKNQELTDVNQRYKNLCSTQKLDTAGSNASDKIKNIMNDTFHSISVNFENNDNYSGEIIKNIIATVIKKVTLKSLNDS
ncbi:uncharacterized protein ACR2FA_012237 [Aphomia sociella]